MTGVKFDGGKILWHLVVWEFIEAGIRVLMLGAKKYTKKDEEGNVIRSGEDNWRLVENRRQRYKNVLQRHTVAYLKGEKIDVGTPEDPGTGESHLACIFCNAMFLFWMDMVGDEGIV